MLLLFAVGVGFFAIALGFVVSNVCFVCFVVGLLLVLVL